MSESMTTSTKILFSFGLAIAVTAFVGIAAYASMERVTERLTELADEEFVAAQALADMQEATTLAARGNATLLLRRADGQMRAAAREDVESALKRIDAAVQTFQRIPHGEQTTQLWNAAQQPLTAWRRAHEALQQVVAERDRLLSQGVARDDARVNAMDERNWAQFQEVRKRFKEAVPALNAVIESNGKSVEAAKQAGRDAARAGMATILTAILVGALVSLAIGVLLARSIRAAIRALLAEAGKLTQAVQQGKLDVRGDVEAVSLEFRPVVEGVNRTVDAFVEPIRTTAENIGRIERGDLPPPITADYRGEFGNIKTSVNGLIELVSRRGKDIDMLIAAAVEGRLDVRADASKYQGGNARVIAGMNSMLDAVVAPVNETAEVLERLAQRDLTPRVKGEYQGEFAKTKKAVNAAAQALHDALSQVAQAVGQVSSASSQIASSSQAVANGASEQASALEETSSSLESMSGMTKQAADNAQQASALAATARSAATEGSAAMEQMTGAMAKIKTSAEGTSQIIKDINEIAFQTNLLALNAAVEAARAGEAGRGFAVVAEEVRSLALRSKEAANKTEELIRQSVKEAGEGEVTATHVNEKLSEIVVSVSKVTEIVAEIAASAKEQAAGIGQVTTAVGEMDKVTQQNAASSEESSSAATELAGQSQELAAMIGSFRLDHGAVSVSKKQSARTTPGPAVKRTLSGKRGTNGLALTPADLIPMGDEHIPGEF